MTRTAQLDTGSYALAYPRDGKLFLIANSDHYSLEKTKLLLSDRVANSEAFPGETIVKLRVNLQWFGNHTGGNESFPAWLSAGEIVETSENGGAK